MECLCFSCSDSLFLSIIYLTWIFLSTTEILMPFQMHCLDPGPGWWLETTDLIYSVFKCIWMSLYFYTAADRACTVRFAWTTEGEHWLSILAKTLFYSVCDKIMFQQFIIYICNEMLKQSRPYTINLNTFSRDWACVISTLVEMTILKCQVSF